MAWNIFVSQSATASTAAEKLHHDFVERRLPRALRAIGRDDLAESVFFDRNQQRNRMNERIRAAAEGASVGLLLHTLDWQASDYVREHELPFFDPSRFHEHGRHAVGVMFHPSALGPGEINRHLGFDADEAGGIQWLTHGGRAYSELGDADRNVFAVEIARRVASGVPASESMTA